MSEKRKGDDDYPDEFGEINEHKSGGKKDGSTPDYEEAMTPNISQDDFDNEKTEW